MEGYQPREADRTVVALINTVRSKYLNSGQEHTPTCLLI
jgi:hypothetical protein